jgi:hypothetical protein
MSRSDRGFAEPPTRVAATHRSDLLPQSKERYWTVPRRRRQQGEPTQQHPADHYGQVGGFIEKICAANPQVNPSSQHKHRCRYPNKAKHPNRPGGSASRDEESDGHCHIERVHLVSDMHRSRVVLSEEQSW